ncbi:MAG: ATP synthase subunit C family protein [Alphaproteobacteria bacterium]
MESFLDLTILKAIGAGFAVLCLGGVAGAIGNVFNAAINSIARNPAAKADIQSFAFIGAAFAEALGLMAVVIAFLILFTL